MNTAAATAHLLAMINMVRNSQQVVVTARAFMRPELQLMEHRITTQRRQLHVRAMYNHFQTTLLVSSMIDNHAD
jgi:hypothetical protein